MGRLMPSNNYSYYKLNFVFFHKKNTTGQHRGAVWDSGNNADGNSSTANFVSGMMKTVPPLNDLFNMAGLNLPSYLKGEEEKRVVEVKEVKTETPLKADEGAGHS